MVKENKSNLEPPALGGSRFDYGPVGTNEETFHIVFDIETGPQQPQDLARMTPKGGFPAKANLVDPEKIAADIRSKEEAFIKKAALSPTTGQVLAIGVRHHGKNNIWHQGDSVGREAEAKVLEEFFNFFRANNTQTWVGWSSNQFDWPFLRKRAWVHGLQFPIGIFDGVVGARWLNYQRGILDAQLAWDEGNSTIRTRLDTACKCLGLTGKTEDGSHFYKIYKRDQDRALAYLANDLEITDQLWEIIG